MDYNKISKTNKIGYTRNSGDKNYSKNKSFFSYLEIPTNLNNSLLRLFTMICTRSQYKNHQRHNNSCEEVPKSQVWYKMEDEDVSFNLSWRRPYHIDTIPLICCTNQWSGFYMLETSIVKEFMDVWVYCLLFAKRSHQS